MSLILDALRKMEQERKSRRGAARDLRPEVLRYRGSSEPQPQGKPYLLVTVGVVLLLAGVGAGALLKGSRGEKLDVAEKSPVAAPATVAAAPAPDAPIARFEPAAPPAQGASAQATPLPAAPAPAAPATRTAAASTVVQPRPAAESRDVMAEAATPPPAPASERSRAGRSRRHRNQASADGNGEGIAIPAAAHGTAVTGPGPRDITLSGIAWQDERNMRRAVLNGTLVGEGAVVAGARVIEIRENKVRLTRGGQTFDIALSSAPQMR
jgi:general secretion pathway protein B